jgi:hypothetical protein
MHNSTRTHDVWTIRAYGAPDTPCMHTCIHTYRHSVSRLFLCSYAPMLLCSYVPMFLCSWLFAPLTSDGILFLYAVCCMLYAVCCMLYAVCCMPYAVCCMPYAVTVSSKKNTPCPCYGGNLWNLPASIFTMRVWCTCGRTPARYDHMTPRTAAVKSLTC